MFTSLEDKTGFPGPLDALGVETCEMLDLQVVFDLTLHLLSGVEMETGKGQVWFCWTAGWPGKASCTFSSIDRAARACLAY